ncbi:Glycosyl transferases group 1 [Mucilaginibacter pineti]|uniref:Glycosyl transferases group 1 n=1 Tax=Mucilaginibacter pineti TaxID=1391627 RepID=A0A1G6W8N9_9SPHI|nr:glycosyltransferase [Mucilaginibacter pineti]SDD62320.1 Glycosyl transferases group 1 [Mucilaginibacter pineti]
MEILYLGDNSKTSTSFHRASALSRLGHNVNIYSPKDCINENMKSMLGNLFHYRTGYRFLQKKIVKWLTDILSKTPKPDLIWVNSGELLGVDCLKKLKELGCPVVLYNNDDPTGGRDKGRFYSLLKAIPYYDLIAVMREINIAEYKALGAKKVMQVMMSYDEVLHKPFSNIDDIPPQFKSDVAFIGTWMRFEKRDEFILTLINKGINVSIWGGRWPKSKYWNQLKPHYKGGALGGKDYIAAIQGAKICLGLLSKGNRDLYTRRSLEIPFIGGLFCAERTSTHMDMYAEGEEAVFWSSAEECAEVCLNLLNNDNLREQIRKGGREKVLKLKGGNEDICKKIIDNI